MEMDPTELERELKALRPAAASPDLEGRIRSSLAEDGASPARYPLRPWVLVLSAAAAVLAVAGVWVCLPRRGNVAPAGGATLAQRAPQEVAAPAPVVPGPVYQGTVLVGQRDEGVVAMGTNGVARKVRCRYVDNVQWQHRGRGVVLTAGVPREEVMLVPVQAY